MRDTGDHLICGNMSSVFIANQNTFAIAAVARGCRDGMRAMVTSSVVEHAA